MIGREYTPEEIAYMLSHVPYDKDDTPVWAGAGNSSNRLSFVDEIAEHLGRSPTSVRRKIEDLRIIISEKRTEQGLSAKKYSGYGRPNRNLKSLVKVDSSGQITLDVFDSEQIDDARSMRYSISMVKHRNASDQSWFRARCLEVYPHVCAANCVYSFGYQDVLEADHIDGNPKNNDPWTNGQLLCINCHRKKTKADRSLKND